MMEDWGKEHAACAETNPAYVPALPRLPSTLCPDFRPKSILNMRCVIAKRLEEI